MSNREPNPGGMWEVDGSDTRRSPAGYLGIKRSNGQKAISVVGASNGSPAMASSQSDGPVNLTIAETSNKGVDCTAPSASPLHQTSVWAKPPTFDGITMSWEEFIMQFNACATINGWTGSEIAPCMFLNLEGEARRFIVGLGVLVEKMVGLVHLGTGCGIVDGIMERQHPPMPLIFSGWWKGHFQGPEDVQQKLALRTLLDSLFEGDLKHTL